MQVTINALARSTPGFVAVNGKRIIHADLLLLRCANMHLARLASRGARRPASPSTIDDRRHRAARWPDHEPVACSPFSGDTYCVKTAKHRRAAARDGHAQPRIASACTA
ncbi:hypothetical protein [Paraburkholderia caballeronis]|uniref:hypothetical protein n=1 Tax=Paraburkholderia caballeronis TaxID=416943 RepID=UPI001065C176|nr:hypothetical protein [Paraburkholderia caballeronis]